MELRKNPKLDLDRKRPLFLQIGLAASLLLTLVAFEWRSEITPIDVFTERDNFEAVYFPPATVIPPPPVPKTEVKPERVKKEISQNIVEVTNEIPVEQFVNSEPFDENDLGSVITEQPPVEDDIEFIVSETMPSFPGGMEKFYQFVSSELKYPRGAVRTEVEGKVYLTFVIDKTGAVNDVKVLKGIGFGCDEEAVRVLKNSPMWNPGKQRGVPVKVRQVIPITFRLD